MCNSPVWYPNSVGRTKFQSCVGHNQLQFIDCFDVIIVIIAVTVAVVFIHIFIVSNISIAMPPS